LFSRERAHPPWPGRDRSSEKQGLCWAAGGSSAGLRPRAVLDTRQPLSLEMAQDPLQAYRRGEKKKTSTGRWTTIEGLSDRKPRTNKCIFSPGNPSQFHKTLKDVGPHFSEGNGCLKKLIAGSGIFFFPPPPFCVWRGCWRSSRISDGQGVRVTGLQRRGGKSKASGSG